MNAFNYNAAYDMAILDVIRGESIKESIKRLYQTGDIDESELGECAARGLIDLADYNEIKGF